MLFAIRYSPNEAGCGADAICTPAPIHNPDGSESLWCYTKPTELYGELRDLAQRQLRHNSSASVSPTTPTSGFENAI